MIDLEVRKKLVRILAEEWGLHVGWVARGWMHAVDFGIKDEQIGRVQLWEVDGEKVLWFRSKFGFANYYTSPEHGEKLGIDKYKHKKIGELFIHDSHYHEKPFSLYTMKRFTLE